MTTKRKIYKWQGVPVLVRWGHCSVKPNTEKPLSWLNYECDVNILGQASKSVYVPAVEITTKDGAVFCIANHFGIGGHKLFKGGWPDCTHFSIPDNAVFKENGLSANAVKRLDEKGYSTHEAARSKWMKDNHGHTEEYRKFIALRRIIASGKHR